MLCYEYVDNINDTPIFNNIQILFIIDSYFSKTWAKWSECRGLSTDGAKIYQLVALGSSDALK